MEQEDLILSAVTVVEQESILLTKQFEKIQFYDHSWVRNVLHVKELDTEAVLYALEQEDNK